MGKQSVENILIPAKFISLALHILIVTMAYFSYHDNILVAYPSLTSSTDILYTGAQTSFLACNSLTVIFLAVEIMILFWGGTMFRQRHNLIISTLHFFGAILWSSFIFQQWDFSQLWALWAVFSLLPFTLEIFAVISTSSKS